MATQQRGAAPAASFINFKPTNFVAGGVLPEGDYLVEEVRVVHWDYDGKIAGASTIAPRFMLRPFVGGKVTADPAIPQYYSAGDPKAFAPNDDGTKMVATSERSQLSKSSNFFTFVENAVNAGFPEDKIEDDFTIWEGLVAHFIQIAQQKRAGLTQSNLVQGQQQQERDRTIPVISAIVKLPWDKAGKTPPRPVAVANKATAAPPAATNGAGSADLLTEYLALVLAAEGSPCARTKARVNVFKSMNAGGVDPATRDAAMKAFGDDATLENALAVTGNGYALDGANIVAV